jgi:hypothetical protein
VRTWHDATVRCDAPILAMGGIADMNGRVASANSVEVDPERPIGVQFLLCCNSLLMNSVVTCGPWAEGAGT